MKFLTILFVTVGLIYGGYKWLYPTVRWNERLTITVSTPDGIKIGASVVRHQIVRQPKVLPDVPSRIYTLEGEAVVVDLGGGKYLFALLNNRGGLGAKVLKSVYNARRDNKTPRLSDEIGHVPIKLMPLLVTFDDVNDPTSIKSVVPENLAATFGVGYVLREITLQVTNEQITNGKIDRVLGWLKGYKDYLRPTGVFVAKSISPIDFSTEVYK